MCHPVRDKPALIHKCWSCERLGSGRRECHSVGQIVGRSGRRVIRRGGGAGIRTPLALSQGASVGGIAWSDAMLLPPQRLIARLGIAARICRIRKGCRYRHAQINHTGGCYLNYDSVQISIRPLCFCWQRCGSSLSTTTSSWTISFMMTL
jgi:hypothetical protein